MKTVSFNIVEIRKEGVSPTEAQKKKALKVISHSAVTREEARCLMAALAFIDSLFPSIT